MGGQCTYRVTLWRVRVTIVDTEKQKFILCFCALSQKARFSYLKHFFECKMQVVIFSTILCEKVLIPRRILQNIIINVLALRLKVPHFCEILMKLEFFFLDIFSKSRQVSN
jgi:hypothetical protein